MLVLTRKPGEKIVIGLESLCRSNRDSVLVDRLGAQPALRDPFMKWFERRYGRAFAGWVRETYPPPYPDWLPGEPRDREDPSPESPGTAAAVKHPSSPSPLRRFLSKLLGRPLPPATS